MAVDQDVLIRMMTTSWKDLDGLNRQLAAIDAGIAKWTEDDTLYKAMMGKAKSDLEAELAVKVAWFDITVPYELDAPHSIIYGPAYNVSNISDWQIVNNLSVAVYIYLGVGWDSNPNIIKNINDWAIIYPLIYDPQFGTQVMLASLIAGRVLIVNRRDQIANRNPILGDFLTFTISASVTDGNGSIIPSGDTIVGAGSDQAVSMTPDLGYVVDNVVVDAVSQGSLGCECNATCYLFSSCGCNATTYDCPCYVACYGQCFCNATCYNQGGCKGDSGCSCYSTCYGYILCSCNMAVDACTCYMSCYGDGCACNATCYNESAAVYTFTDIEENHTISVRFRV